MHYVVIPARYGSTRLLGKPLLTIGDRYVLFHVLDQIQKVFPLSQVRVATDNDLIMKACEMYGVKSIMTSTGHDSGTDRIAEVCKLEGWNEDDVVINVQGDEPFIPTSLLEELKNIANSDKLKTHTPSMFTCFHKIKNYNEMFNPNVVKVTLSNDNKAMYFSRAPIPWHRDTYHFDLEGLDQPFNHDANRHIGVYVYSVKSLFLFSSLSSELEQIEKLEQLKLLQNNVPIFCFEAKEAPVHGIDTRSDLAAANSYWVKKQNT